MICKLLSMWLQFHCSVYRAVVFRHVHTCSSVCVCVCVSACVSGSHRVNTAGHSVWCCACVLTLPFTVGMDIISTYTDSFLVLLPSGWNTTQKAVCLFLVAAARGESSMRALKLPPGQVTVWGLTVWLSVGVCCLLINCVCCTFPLS